MHGFTYSLSQYRSFHEQHIVKGCSRAKCALHYSDASEEAGVLT